MNYLSRFLRQNGLFVAFFCVISLIFLLSIQNEPSETEFIKTFQSRLTGLEMEAQSGLDSLVVESRSEQIETLRSNWQQSHSNFFNEKGIVFLIYEKDSLIFWTDHAPAVENYRKQVCLDNSLARLRNGWFEVLSHPVNKFETRTYLALLLLKHEYSYQNKYLICEFPARFGLPDNVSLMEDNLNKTPNTIYNANGIPLFQLVFTNNQKTNPARVGTIAILYLFLVLLLIFISNKLALFYFSTRNSYFKSLTFIAALLVLRYLMILFNFPEVWHKSSLYDSRIYGNVSSFFFSHLGDVVLNASLLFFISAFLSSNIKKLNLTSVFVFFPIALLFAAFLVSLLLNWLVTDLVQNSHISFRIHEVFSLSFHSWIGFFSVGLLMLTVYFLAELGVYIFQSRKLHFKTIYFSAIIAWLLHGFIIYLLNDLTLFPETWFWPFFLLLCFLKSKTTNYSFSYGIPFVIFFSLVFGYLFFREEHNKEIEMRKIYAQDLSNRQDDVAEHLFVDIARKIKTDNKLNRMVSLGAANSLDIEQRLRQEYFSGYWEKFDILLSLVDSACVPVLITDNPIHGNHTYFDEQIEKSGSQTINDELFYIESSTERPRYVARIKIKLITDTLKKPSVLYVQLEPKLTDDLTGFPELLLDKKVKTNTKLSEYSIGIYKNSKLIGREGKFDYSAVSVWKMGNETTLSQSGGFSHLILGSGTTQVVLSRQNDIQRELIAFFTFFFTFLSLLLLLVLVFIAMFFRKKISGSSISSRIQLLLVAILLISLFSFGYGTYSVMRSQYENQNTNALEKLSKSVRADIEIKLGNAPRLDDNYREFATYQLKKAAGIFLSDICIFDLKGNLIASSQPRLFDEGILSRKKIGRAHV